MDAVMKDKIFRLEAKAFITHGTASVMNIDIFDSVSLAPRVP